MAIVSTHSVELQPYQIVLRPLVTEKGTHVSTRHNAYAFEVHPLASKSDIKRAVETLWEVRVVGVRTQNRVGTPWQHALILRSRFRMNAAGGAFAQMIGHQHGARRRKTMSFEVGEKIQDVGAAFNTIERRHRGFNAEFLADALPYVGSRVIDDFRFRLIVAHAGDGPIENETWIVMSALHLLPSI